MTSATMNPYLRSLSSAVEEFVVVLNSLLELYDANTGTPTMRAFYASRLS